MIGHQLTVLAQQYPGRTAVVFEGRRLDYASLEDRCRRLAGVLADRGVGRGGRVAALLHNCSELVELMFASAMIGAIHVPLNFRLTAAELERVLAACTPRVLVAGAEFEAVLAELASAGALPADVIVVDEPGGARDGARGTRYEASLAARERLEAPVEVGTDDAHLIVHSSGTTGEPKGAVWSHGTTWFSSLAKIVDFRIDSGDVVVVFGPLYHVGPLMDFAVPVLLRGGTLVLGRSRAFDPAVLLETLDRERATIVTIYPTLWQRVLRAAELGRFDGSSLRILSTGGEPIGTRVLESIYRRFPDVGFVNTYGSTEGGPITTFLAPEHRFDKIGSVGKPAFGVDLRIVDDEGRCLGSGEVGEIVVRSPFVCRGYWRRPDLTGRAQRGGWWHTGDLAWRDADGFVWIGGRKKDLIITGAENVYPAEVEQVLAAVDGIAEAAVIGVADEEWGERVVAYVVREPGSDLDAEAVRARCRRRLAGYKLPREVVFVERLPRTTTNKISRDTLRALYAQRGAVDG